MSSVYLCFLGSHVNNLVFFFPSWVNTNLTKLFFCPLLHSSILLRSSGSQTSCQLLPQFPAQRMLFQRLVIHISGEIVVKDFVLPWSTQALGQHAVCLQEEIWGADGNSKRLLRERQAEQEQDRAKCAAAKSIQMLYKTTPPCEQLL